MRTPLAAWLALNLAAICAGQSKHPILVLIAFDGIPQQYLHSGHSPFLQQLAASGATTEWMLPQLPGHSLPNLQSIATGLDPAVHGVQADQTVVEGVNQTLECSGYSEKMYTRKANVTPIWTLNELSGGGRYSGVSAWPGAEFGYRGHKGPKFQIKLTDCTQWTKRVDQALTWLTDASGPANLVLLHFEAASNRSAQPLAQTLNQVDDLVRYYFEQLDAHKIRDQVNTVVLSDHSDTNSSLGVMPECGRAQVTLNQTSCLAGILKSHTQLSTLENAFKAVEYAKLRSTRGSASLSKEAEQYLNAQEARIFQDPTKYLDSVGVGEKNEGMFPLFIATGPLFQPNHKTAPFQNTDIYALVSHVLNLTQPLIPTNSSFEGIQALLRVKDEPVHESSFFKVLLFFIVGLLLIACAWYIIRMRKQERIRF